MCSRRDLALLLFCQVFGLAIRKTHGDFAMGKFDTFAFKQHADFFVNPFANQPLITGLGHEFHPNDHRRILHFDHTL